MPAGAFKKDEAKNSPLPGENQKTRSIARNLTVSLILSIALISIVFISLIYLNASRRERAWIENKADESVIILADIIKIPLWNFNRESIENIGISFLNNYLIVKLKIFDASGEVFFEKEKEDDGDLIERAGKVFHNGELLGYVEISLTSRYYKERNRQLLWSSILATLIVILCLTILTGFLLRIYLRKPIEQLSEIVNSYTSGEYDSTKHWIPFLEFQQFVDVLDGMGEKITAHITELQNAEEKYRALFESANEAIYVTQDRMIKLFNPKTEDLYGYSGDELTSKPFTHFIHKEDREMVLERLLKWVKGAYPLRIINKNGDIKWVELNVAGFSWDGRPATLCFMTDITERRQAEEKIRDYSKNLEGMVQGRTSELKATQEAMLNLVEDLNDSKEELENRALELEEMNIRIQEATETKSQFLANMSHELRTPLNAIIGFSEILADQTFGEMNERQTRYINNVLVSGRHLLQLINDILDLSKVEAGKLELEQSKISLKGLLENSLIMIKEKAMTHGIKLDLDLSYELTDLEILADERKLKQIMFNLLSNAAKFTPDGGAITTSAQRNGEDLIISVADTGIGIKPEDQERVFIEFEQVDSTYARKQQGTGLGLALTRRLVELHGGRIWVESEGLGKGSAFTFVIPIKAEEREGEVSVEPEEPLPSLPDLDDSRPLVLVVEDDRQASELISQYLSEADYAVAHAFNGEQAIQMARELKPYAITLDILLPKKDGWEVLAELKSLPETKDIPALIISITEDRQSGLNLGAIEYFVKPVNREQLIEAVRKAGAVLEKEKMTVLVVDDEPQTVEMLADGLRAGGFSVLKAYGGQQGIDLAIEEHPDVIILDLMMPEVSGFDVVQQLRAHPEAMEIPILIFTAKDLTEEDRQRLEGHVKMIASKSGSGKEDLLRELEKVGKMEGGT